MLPHVVQVSGKPLGRHRGYFTVLDLFLHGVSPTAFASTAGSSAVTDEDRTWILEHNNQISISWLAEKKHGVLAESPKKWDFSAALSVSLFFSDSGFEN